MIIQLSNIKVQRTGFTIPLLQPSFPPAADLER